MEERKHTRIPLSTLKENPEKGIYLTRNEMNKYSIFTGFIFLILTCFAVFNRKY